VPATLVRASPEGQQLSAIYVRILPVAQIEQAARDRAILGEGVGGPKWPIRRLAYPSLFRKIRVT
jgi:hypothetical protein